MDSTENKSANGEYFNKEKFHTIFVKSGASSENKNESIANLTSLLTDPTNKEHKNDILKLLKEHDGLHLLIDAISKNKKEHLKSILVAACWESDCNCSSHLSFFVDLILNAPILVCLEAATVVESMEGPFKKDELSHTISRLEEFLSSATNAEKERIVFADAACTYLKGFQIEPLN
ncbi:MAG: hypothetical protein J0M08_13855 [Bacteroidetes bacterium]|nr:hypothetical protein [Bacteroidota bacterium]